MTLSALRFFRPRSLTGLMLIGLAFVAVPLLIAVVTAAAKVRDLSEQSAALVQSGVTSTHDTQQLLQQMNAMERGARFYQTLKSNEALAVYSETRNRFRQTLAGLARFGADEPRAAQLRELQRLQSAIDEALLAPGPVNDGAAALQLFNGLWDAGSKLSDLTGRQIDSGLANLQAATAATQRYLFALSAGMIALTFAVVSLFTWRVVQPIRQIDSAINRLGKGAFSKPIAIKGPLDMEALGQQLEWLRMRLLEIAQERNRFLRHMSHELKTPLAAVREGAELLMDGAVGSLDDNQREVLSILRDNSIRLQRLIENLLSFSAWQARHSTLELTDVRLRSLIKSALETHQMMALSQRVRLDLQVADIEFRADRAKLKLILDNLLSNALKYTPRGGTIYLHAHTEGDDVVLDVADTGQGIAKDEREAIFDAFYSGRAPQAGQLKGTGIGLSVVLEFVQAHGGSIEVMDNIFPGAHFRVRLPLTPSAQKAVA